MLHNYQTATAMAALNHMRNRKSQRTRDGYEDFIARCLDGGTDVKIEVVLGIFENAKIEMDGKDLQNMVKLANKNKLIQRLRLFTIDFII